MPLSLFALGGDVLVFCHPSWLEDNRTPINLDALVNEVITIAASHAELEGAVEKLSIILQRLPISDDQRGTLELVASDLMVNAIDYGKPGAARTIDLGIVYIPGVIVSVGVTDTLGPLPLEDFQLNPTTEAKLAELSEHGRGLYIAQSLADLFVYVPNGRKATKEIFVALKLDTKEVEHGKCD